MFLFSAVFTATAGVTESKNKTLNVLLVAVPVAGHINSIFALGEELVDRGHNVTMYSLENWFQVKRKSQERGFNYISAGNFIINNETEFRKRKISILEKENSWNPFIKMQGMLSMMKMLKNMTETLTENVIESGHDLRQWDVIVVDFFQYSLTCYATSKGVPSVIVADVAMVNYNPWAHPILFSASSSNLNFFGRIQSEMMYIFTMLTGLDVVNTMTKMDSTRAGSTCRDILPSYPLQMHPVLVRSVIGLDYPQVLLPLTSHVGPLLSKHLKPLQDDLIQWLTNKDEKSIVYISMGSIVSINEDTAKAFVNGISQTKYSVIWALNKANQYILSNINIDNQRFFISNWIPQVTILQHTSISMALLHGGANGINEALKFGIPLIIVPHMGDQFAWAVKVERAGVGVQIPHASMITTSLIKESIEKIESGSYREKAQRMQLIIEAAGGVDKGSDLIEFYGRVGYDHLLPAPIQYNWNWIQYYNIDVKLLLVSILLITVLIVFKMCRQCCCRDCCFSKKKDKLE